MRGSAHCGNETERTGRGEDKIPGKPVENPGGSHENHENLWKSQENLRKIHENPGWFSTVPS